MATSSFLSADGVTDIHYHIWLPDAPPRAVLVIFHGMLEYSTRYEEFARFLNHHDIAVFAQDHLGHGNSCATPAQRGHFGNTNGNSNVIQDCHEMVTIANEAYPDLPLFLLGHSMGSFLLRQLLHQCELPPLAGVLLMGTGQMPENVIRLGRNIAKGVSIVRGPAYKSQLLYKLLLGSNNKRIRDHHSKSDWLSRDHVRVDAYDGNPMIIDNFTAKAYSDMLSGMLTNYDAHRLSSLDTHIPLILLSGDADPIGSYGKGVEKLYDQYEALGYEDLTLKLYPGARHELLNETNRGEVMDDILAWLDNHIR